jgi:two-component system CheB/CheR fusion protein
MAGNITLKDLLQEFAEQRNFDFRGYKKTTLERRFRRRMFQLNMPGYAEYGNYIRQHPEEMNRLLTTILINVTEFFRDPPAWEILRHELLPPLLNRLKPGHSFRAWSAGCASGEEAYSIAMLLAEHFGPRIRDYDIKIYATDIDDEELNAARRGEYSLEAVRKIRPEWREKYFRGKELLRVNREIRRLVIFGKSNLAQDAPISHVNLLVCRNLLIYFDSNLQKQILNRLHYALDPNGILFLGKSESQLTNSQQFQRLNSRWRIFRRISGSLVLEDRVEMTHDIMRSATNESTRAGVELETLKQHQRHLMETLRVGVIALDLDDVVLQLNTYAQTLFGLAPSNMVDKPIGATELYSRLPELGPRLAATRLNNEASRLETRVKVGTEEKLIEVTLRPLVDERGERTGTMIYLEDQSIQEKLQATVEELESTSEELQSANEELETTNEELQSTNEELETTNEELQSTNEELETTNEELQSLNEELETTNQELEERTKELDQVNSVYSQTLEKMRLPVMLVNQERHIEFWNSRALTLFGFKNKPPMDLTVDQLPLSQNLRALLIRRHRQALANGEPNIARNQFLGDQLKSVADIHFSVIPREDRTKNVLIMFEPITGKRKVAPKKSSK